MTGVESDRRPVAVLFADVVGFTALSERLDPEVVTDAMNEFFATLAEQVAIVDGHVDKFVGDQVMALFGAPLAHEDDALRAVRAALGMQRVVRMGQERLAAIFGEPLRLRIGIHSGIVIWGEVGPPGQARPTVMGDVVNVAQRLQNAAPDGGLLVSEAVWRQVRGSFLGKAWEPIVVKGKVEPLVVYEVLGEREHAEPIHRPPFVDRREDLDQLRDLLERARRGRAQVVVVVGDPGVGKTRLVEEFTRALPDDTVLLETACPPYAGQSLEPLADLFRQFAGLPRRVTLEDVASRIPLGDRSAEAGAIVSRLFNLLDEPAPAPPPAGGSAAADHSGPDVSGVSHETAQLVAAEAIRAMLRKITVAWIEDLQWADPGTREVLPVIVERLTDAPLLLIANVRAGEPVVSWGRRTAVTTLQLDPLPDEDARSLLRKIVGEPLPTATEAALIAKAGGNPFYLSEIVATLQTEAALVKDDRGHWHVPTALDAVLPDTIQTALRSRLDRLAPGPRLAVQRAAVIGVTFRASLLQALLPEVPLAAVLRDLEDAYLIRRRDPLAADPEWVFVHPLLRDVAYASLLRKTQTALHQRVAEAMERLYPNELAALAKTIGTHFDRAGQAGRAVPHLLSAGRQAALRYATHEAIDLLERVRDLSADAHDPGSCVAACELLGELYKRVQDRGPREWFAAWNSVLVNLGPQADPPRRGRALIWAADARAHDNRIEEAERLLDEAEALVPGDDLLRSDLDVTRAYVLVMRSEYRGALAQARAAVAVANRHGSLPHRARAYAMLAHAALLPLMGEDGRRLMREWMAEAEATGDLRLVADARMFLMTDMWTRGIVDADVLRIGEEGLRHAVEFGWTRDEVTHHLLLGWGCFLAGRWQQAATHLDQAHLLVEAHGGRLQGAYHILLPYFRGNLAMSAGRPQEARTILEEALLTARFHAPVWLNHALAQSLFMLGETAGARASLERSLEARDRVRCIICGCQANGIVAELYALLGEPERAGALAAEAWGTAGEIGHVATLIRVHRTRAHLGLRASPADAVEEARAAVRLGQGLPLAQPFEEAQSWAVLAEAGQAAGDDALAAGAREEALLRFRSLGAAWHLRALSETRTIAGGA